MQEVSTVAADLLSADRDAERWRSRPSRYCVGVSASPQQRVLLVGAGGHARVCLDALRDGDGTVVIGAVSADGTGIDGLGVPMLGTEHDIDAVVETHGITSFCVAIGSNAARRRVVEQLVERGRSLAAAVSAAATISPSVQLGAGPQIIAGAVINAATSLGRATIVNTNASVDHDCRIGDYVHVAPGVALGGSVIVGDGAFIGLGARVLPGLRIGHDTIVGGGAVVIRDVPDGTVVVGNPARPVVKD